MCGNVGKMMQQTNSAGERRLLGQVRDGRHSEWHCAGWAVVCASCWAPAPQSSLCCRRDGMTVFCGIVSSGRDSEFWEHEAETEETVCPLGCQSNVSPGTSSL